MLVLMPAAVLCNQPAPVAAPKPVVVSPAADISSEREIARRDFLEARQRFAGALVAMMTSEELSQRAAAISARLQVRQTNARLVEVRNRLAVIEGSPDSSVEEVARLKEREESLVAEIERLQNPTVAPAEDQIKLAAQVVANRFQTSMAEESAYLADVLSAEELQRRTQRLGRLTLVGGIIGGLRQSDRETQALGEDDPLRDPAVVPASRSVEARSSDDSLGEKSATPPSDLGAPSSNAAPVPE